MGKELFNQGWEFCKAPLHTQVEVLPELTFVPVNLPHDYLIYNTDQLYEDSTGIYRKRFSLKKESNRVYEVYFEGVYMDTTVYLNGSFLGEWKYGYSSFYFDMTELLVDGENELVVKVDHQSPNSRWYSGAGIYRDVFLYTYPKCHFVTDSFYVSAKPQSQEQISAKTDLTKEWNVRVSAEISGLEETFEKETSVQELSLLFCIPELGVKKEIPLADTTLGKLQEQKKQDSCTKQQEQKKQDSCTKRQDQETQIFRSEFQVEVEHPLLWSLESPNLYEVELRLQKSAQKSLSGDGEKIGNSEGNDGESGVNSGVNSGESSKECVCLDLAQTRMGFRSFTFDCNEGFFLNGVHTKINGVCEHHDLGALGAAFNRTAMKRKYVTLRKMGVNAIRTSHNMPAVEMLNLADELGFLVLDEAFDMWEGCKTTYDYGRFFKEWQERDVRSWIRRDRNHPSIFMWSIGNEIYDTHKDDHGQDITRYLQREARENDFYENAVIGIGSNYMPWEGAQKCADILKFAGYNYAEKFYDEHHAKYPDWYIFGSETSSTVQSRGIYHFPLRQPVLADDDEQCSSLGNSTTSWGAPNSEYCIIAERDHAYSLGQFLWTGFDYIGEPTPYQTRNSYFGQIDTAGFPKDSFYVYKSAWTDYRTEPFVHVFPYWDFNQGEPVDVRIASNAPTVELFVNGVSMGKQEIDHAHGTKLTGDYSVCYEPGEITAVAYDDKGTEIARQTKRSFGEAATISVKPWSGQEELIAGIGDMAFLEVEVLDEAGNPVENANNRLQVKVEGAGWLAGLDNGDSTDKDQYKGSTKRLFSGKMLIIVAVGTETGEIHVRVTGENLKSAECRLSVEKKQVVSGISLAPQSPLTTKEQDDDLWVRKIELASEQGFSLNQDQKEVVVTAHILPAEAEAFVKPSDLIWKTVTDSGIESPLAKIVEAEGNRVRIKGLGDGSFRLRCMAKNGTDIVKVISSLEFTSEGFGEALLNPYEFVAGGIWSYCEGELGNGNNHGVSMPRVERGVVGFENLNFGSYGSDEVELQIFNLTSDPYPMQIWEGIPEKEGSRLLADVVYHKPSIWNVYQPETYHLSHRLTGITNLYIVTYDKAHIGGFTFTKKEKAFELLPAGGCDAVYGDAFTHLENRIENIGNNVTVEFTDMDFGPEGTKQLSITGATSNPVNTIHVLFEGESGSCRDILEFAKDGGATQRFAVSGYRGKGTVRFVFLPGSQFDFDSLQFEK